MAAPPPELIWIVIAIFGGLARYLDTFMKNKEPFSVANVLASAFICGFTGFITAEVMLLVYPQWALVSAGIGGYLGTEVMNYLFGAWKNRMSLGGEPKNGNGNK